MCPAAGAEHCVSLRSSSTIVPSDGDKLSVCRSIRCFSSLPRRAAKGSAYRSPSGTMSSRGSPANTCSKGSISISWQRRNNLFNSSLSRPLKLRASRSSSILGWNSASEALAQVAFDLPASLELQRARAPICLRVSSTSCVIDFSSFGSDRDLKLQVPVKLSRAQAKTRSSCICEKNRMAVCRRTANSCNSRNSGRASSCGNPAVGRGLPRSKSL
mmetsp:Transcript_135875/g.344006  ORF Transcript_135875/g.344006 Transcript_135875/m.344006 type:complete len:215 (+) Transcript_135875:388-1032(+)